MFLLVVLKCYFVRRSKCNSNLEVRRGSESQDLSEHEHMKESHESERFKNSQITDVREDRVELSKESFCGEVPRSREFLLYPQVHTITGYLLSAISISDYNCFSCPLCICLFLYVLLHARLFFFFLFAGSIEIVSSFSRSLAKASSYVRHLIFVLI